MGDKAQSASDEHRKYRTKGLAFVMDAFDEVVFTYALRDAFSRVDIIDESWTEEADPPVRQCETLAHGGYMKQVYVRLDAAQTDSDRPSSNEPRAGEGMHWFQHARSGWSFSDRVTSRWPFDFPYLEEGELQTFWYLDDAAALATVRKVSHLLTRVTTNRAKHLYPGRTGCDIKVYRYRFGHHALLWCSRNPDSIIGDRFRPADDWSVPTSKWYQDLWQRVLRDYGEDFADPALRGSLVQFVGPVPWEG